MGFSIGYDKGYKCFVCNKMYGLDDAEKFSWKCPICGEYIRIASPELCSGHTKIRKKASEVVKYDSINLAGVDDIYDVLGITEKKNGKITLGLKNYGAIDLSPDDFVDVIDGAYYEDHWKEI